MAKKPPIKYNPSELPAPTLQPSGLSELNKRRHLWLWILSGIVIAFILAFAGSYMWYQNALKPLKPNSHAKKVRVDVVAGSTADVIGNLLQKKHVIRSSEAFQVYTRLNKTRDHLQAGIYAFSPSQSVPSIAKQLVDGRTSILNVTIYPGTTLKQIKKTLEKQGFKAGNIDSALKATYSSPLLADKPATASLEGYLFPETYQMSAGDSPEALFQRSIDELSTSLKQEQLIKAFKAKKLTVYQALTLASIIQQEVSTPKDQKQVAEVFYNRLKHNLPLGSDVTFIYAAKQLGVAPSPDLDSAYNTRIHKGLPPGPISNMTISALEAVAHPASGDYLFFVAGDDGTVHFAHTAQEHEQNIKKYCHHLCQ